MTSPLRVMVAAKDFNNRQALENTLARCGFQPIALSTVAESRAILAKEEVSLVMCEDTLADGSYREILRDLGRIATKAPVIVFSRLADWDRYLEAMRWGAFDYIAYPCRPNEVELTVNEALRTTPLFP